MYKVSAPLGETTVFAQYRAFKMIYNSMQHDSSNIFSNNKR